MPMPEASMNLNSNLVLWHKNVDREPTIWYALVDAKAKTTAMEGAAEHFLRSSIARATPGEC